MKWLKRIFNPLMAFIGIQVAWVLAVIVWLNWFLGNHRKLRALAEEYSPELLVGGPDWLILTEGLLLLVSILVGVYVIFLYWRKQSSLVREQRQFISQVTHELKSPLASLQLHLETVRRHQPSPEQMAPFVETMLSDANRLNGLIDNLLSANRVGQKHWRLELQSIDFSAFVEKYFRDRQFTLPKAGKLSLDIKPGIFAAIDQDAMETVSAAVSNLTTRKKSSTFSIACVAKTKTSAAPASDCSSYMPTSYAITARSKLKVKARARGQLSGSPSPSQDQRRQQRPHEETTHPPRRRRKAHRPGHHLQP